jgi:putative transposase
MKRSPKTTAFWTGRLPHWEVEEGRYFITIHTAGAIPAPGRARIRTLADQFRAEARQESDDWLRIHRAVFREMEDWLDRAAWNAKLKIGQVAEMVVEAIEHRRQRGDWQVFEFVVMPTHLHMFAEVGAAGLKTTLEDFKRWTGHKAGKILGEDGERFWQREWFDHWSRSDEQDERIVRYIRNNPVKAGLVRECGDWPYGSFGRSRLPDGA